MQFYLLVKVFSGDTESNISSCRLLKCEHCVDSFRQMVTIGDPKNHETLEQTLTLR